MLSQTFKPDYKKLFLTLLTVAVTDMFLICILYYVSSGNMHYLVKDSKLDITHWNYEGTLSLSGKWDF